MFCCGEKSGTTRSPPTESTRPIPRSATAPPAPVSETKPIWDHAEWRTHVIHFYEHHKNETPETEVDRMLRGYEGREEVLIVELAKTFGSKPAAQLRRGFMEKSLPTYDRRDTPSAYAILPRDYTAQRGGVYASTATTQPPSHAPHPLRSRAALQNDLRTAYSAPPSMWNTASHDRGQLPSDSVHTPSPLPRSESESQGRRLLSATLPTWSVASASTGIEFTEEHTLEDDTEPQHIDPVTSLESEISVSPKKGKPKFDPTAPYTKESELGRGSFGSVFKVRHKSTFEVCALKEMHGIDCVKCVREVEIMTDLEHPNVIEYLGAYHDDNVCRIFMEYAVGGSLAQVLRDSEPDERTITPIVRQILLGVEYLHDCGVVHHDLKCENILLQQPGHGVVAKIADFGAAKELAQTAASYTGTCGFMAPEMVKFQRDKTNPPTEKADIWSLGCVVLQLLTAHPPNVRPSCDRFDMAQQVMQQVPGTVSDDCRRFIKDCVQMHPEARPSCTELLCYPWLNK